MATNKQLHIGKIEMKKITFIAILLAFFLNFNEISASTKLDAPIFDDDVTLPYFNARKPNILLEVKIAPSNGSGPVITADTGDRLEGDIPNTLNALYAMFPDLREKVSALLKDDYYLMISETLSERGSREKVTSFIGAYAGQIK